MPTELVPIGAGEDLTPFCEAGVLEAADVHLARLVCRTCGEPDPTVALAIALACRELRSGSVHLDPTRVREEVERQLRDPAVVSSADPRTLAQLEVLDTLEWPEPRRWLETLAASPAVAGRDDPPNRLPVRLDDGLVHLEKYWLAESEVALALAELASRRPEPSAHHQPTASGATLPGGAGSDGRPVGDAGSDGRPVGDAGPGGRPADDAAGRTAEVFRRARIVLDPAQVSAARAAVTHRVSVLAGGPGTGKTTTVSAILAALHLADPAGGRVALAAPSGKAASRLRDALAETLTRLREGASAAGTSLPDDVLGARGEATTVHSLLEWKGPGHGFGRDRLNPLAHGVVVVDEASMLSLPLAARLLEAIGPRTRLVLVGDPGQLVSVDAGSVLADVVSSAGVLADSGRELPVTTLTRNHRSGGAIAALAEAVRAGEWQQALTVLEAGDEAVTFVDADPATTSLASLGQVVEVLRDTASHLTEAARAGDDAQALALVDRHRLLCAHRSGPYGVDEWSAQMDAVLADLMPGLGSGRWVLGETTMVTHNMRQMDISNGDCGVIVADRPVPTVALPGPGGSSRRLACSLVSSLQPLQAMTIHKAQGSQFHDVTVVLPPPESPLLTRQLFYTALTRARRHLTVVGTRESVQRAVSDDTRRHSGLERRWRRLPPLAATSPGAQQTSS